MNPTAIDEPMQPALFEGMKEKPISECQRQLDGQTIRDKKGRTVRHKPWWMLVGRGPADKTCGDCEYLRGPGYLKCGRQLITFGPGTDIRKKDEACRMFKERA